MDYQSIHPRYPELKGQVAIVTGAGRGIGKAIAARLLREGMRVILNDRSEEDLKTSTSDLESLGMEVRPVLADLSRKEEVDRLVHEALAVFGTVDVLVNNAAILQMSPFFTIDEALWEDEINVNVKAPFFLSQAVATEMKKKGRGSIINISSVGGLRTQHRGMPYTTTKGAVDTMTRGMGIELADQGIRVNAVAPGAIWTERRRPLDDPKMKAHAELIPARRMGVPLEIAAVVAFLASDEARYIIGQIIYVDGGITAQLSPPQHRI